MTEDVRREQALRQSELSLREADRRKDEFLAMLAHELRNPLAPIRNALHLMSPPRRADGAASSTSRNGRWPSGRWSTWPG